MTHPLPNPEVRGFRYDLADNLKFIEEPDASTIEFGYDAADQLTSKLLPGGEEVGFAYDEVGNVIYAEDADSLVTFLYDGPIVCLRLVPVTRRMTDSSSRRR